MNVLKTQTKKNIKTYTIVPKVFPAPSFFVDLIIEEIVVKMERLQRPHQKLQQKYMPQQAIGTAVEIYCKIHDKAHA